MSSGYKTYRQSGTSGFTLIELLVVMSLVAILMSFVGPMTIKGLEKAEAKSELLSLKQWLNDLSFKSQVSSQRLTVRLEGKRADVLDEQKNVLEQHSFEYVFFQPAVVTFNRLGIPSRMSLQASYRDELLTLQLDNRATNPRSG
jgi:prepilin-type N-terminal cleavage/methylation domain-containing protein